MGPFQTKSLGGASYVLTFIDYFSRMTFGYLLEHKDQTFESFKIFKAFVENQMKVLEESLTKITCMIFIKHRHNNKNNSISQV